MQNLYLREPVPLPGWTIAARNHELSQSARSARFIRKIVGPEVRLDAGSPFDGSEVSVSTYEDGHAEEIIEATKRAITQALSLGFRKQDIAVLSFRGREGSALTAVEQLGPHRLRASPATTICSATRSIARATCCSNRSIASRGNPRRA